MDKFDLVRLHQNRQAAAAKASGVSKAIVKIDRHSCGGTAIRIAFATKSGLAFGDGNELEIATSAGNSRIDLDKAATVLAEGGWFRPRVSPPNEIILTC